VSQKAQNNKENGRKRRNIDWFLPLFHSIQHTDRIGTQEEVLSFHSKRFSKPLILDKFYVSDVENARVLHVMAVIGVEPAVKYSFVLKGMQTTRKGQYNAEWTLSPRLYVKPLIT